MTLGKGSLLFTAACAYAFPRYGRRRKSVARICFSGGRNPRQIPDGRKSLSHKKEPDHGKEATLELGWVADRAGHAPQRLWGRGAGPDDGREVSDSGRGGRQVQCRDDLDWAARRRRLVAIALRRLAVYREERPQHPRRLYRERA